MRGQVAAVQVPVALLYCTVPYRAVPYRTVFVLTFCMSVASVKCMHIVALHYLLSSSVRVWGKSVRLFTPSVRLSVRRLLSGLRRLSPINMLFFLFVTFPLPVSPFHVFSFLFISESDLLAIPSNCTAVKMPIQKFETSILTTFCI